MSFAGGKDDKNTGGTKPKADFSDVSSGSSTTAPGAGQRADSERTIVVEKGDTLSKIAKREYGDAEKWHEIFKANSDTIKNPDLIYPGQTLRLP